MVCNMSRTMDCETRFAERAVMTEADRYKGRILIADDSPTVVSILQVTLEDEGYEVIPAIDGLEAMNKTYREEPDLIVLDIFMPKINGYQVCRLLKNDESTSHIPIIMLTGSERGDRFWSLRTGADEFQTKDFESLDLTGSIERLLSNRDVTYRLGGKASRSTEIVEPGDQIQILSKLTQLLDGELYKSTIEKIRLETILDSLGEGV
jgi:CheY-like chemotaxis protein